MGIRGAPWGHKYPTEHLGGQMGCQGDLFGVTGSPGGVTGASWSVTGAPRVQGCSMRGPGGAIIFSGEIASGVQICFKTCQTGSIR